MSLHECSNNLDDVADHWERIKLSYEILMDSRTRIRYDRHEMIADPGAAMKRAALDTVGKGIRGMGKGLFADRNYMVENENDPYYSPEHFSIVIGQYDGKRYDLTRSTDQKEFEELKDRDYLLWLGPPIGPNENWYIDGKAGYGKSVGRWINHSEDSNAYFKVKPGTDRGGIEDVIVIHVAIVLNEGSQ